MGNYCLYCGQLIEADRNRCHNCSEDEVILYCDRCGHRLVAKSANIGGDKTTIVVRYCPRCGFTSSQKKEKN